MSAEFVLIFGRQTRLAVLAAATFASSVSFGTPASAGLLDFLFGRPQPQPVMVAPPPPAARAARPRILRDEPRGPRPYIAPEVVAGPLGRFLRDPSLRRGDVVATPDGLMVFQGRGGSGNHTAADFVPVSRAAGVGGARRNDLINLDRTVRASNPNIEFVAEKPQARTLLIAKRPDGEPRGGFVAPAAAKPPGTELAEVE